MKTLVEYLGTFFGKKPYSTYCQNCNRDLTSDGGDVGNGIIYCHGGEVTERCSIVAMFRTGATNAVLTNFYKPGQVQREIIGGRLRNFGKLELSVV